MSNDVVAPSHGDDVLVVDVDQTREFPDGRPVTPKLIGMNDLWDIVFFQQPDQKNLRSFSVTVLLKKDIKYAPVIVDRSP